MHAKFQLNKTFIKNQHQKSKRHYICASYGTKKNQGERDKSNTASFKAKTLNCRLQAKLAEFYCRFSEFSANLVFFFAHDHKKERAKFGFEAETELQSFAEMGETNAAATTVDDDLLLKNFFAEVSEVERDNEVLRYLPLSLARSYLCVALFDFVFSNCNSLFLSVFCLIFV